MRAHGDLVRISAAAVWLTLGQVAVAGGEPLRLTLDEARARALRTSPGVAVARLQLAEKQAHARSIVAQFFPKVSGTATYLHYSRTLGTTLTGPRGAPIEIAFLDRDQVLAAATVTQPLTPLFALWALLDIARADERIARAKEDAASATAAYELDHAFWQLLVAQKQHAAAPAQADDGPSIAAVRLRAVRARKELQLTAQLEQLTAQLDQLIGEPAGTALELVPPPPTPAQQPLPNVDDALQRARRSCPALREADETAAKAQAATRLAKLQLGPEIAAVGGWAYQRVIPLVPNNFGFVGVQASWTLLDFGKAYHELRERQAQLAQARLGQTVAVAKLAGELGQALRTIELDGRILQSQADEVAALQALPPTEEGARALAEAGLARVEAERDLWLAHAELARLCGTAATTLADTAAPAAAATDRSPPAR